MNKTWKIFGILLLAANLFVLNSCGLLEAPEQEWEQYNIEYKGVELDCYVMFSSTETVYTQKTIPAGFTVLIVPDASETSVGDILDDFNLDTNYIYKHWGINESLTVADEAEGSEEKSITVTKNKYSVLYHAVNWTKKDAKAPEETYFEKSKYKEFDISSCANFSLKAVLKQVLLSIL